MKLRTVVNSPSLNKLAFWLGEHLPRRFGRWLAKRIALLMASRKNAEQVRAVRANQSVVRGNGTSQAALDQAVKQVYIHSSLCLFDFYHCFRSPKRIREKITFDESFEAFAALSKAKEQGLLGLIIHSGSYDLAGAAMVLDGMDPFILSYPAPNEAYQFQNQLRRDAGLNVAPLSPSVLAKAIQCLKNKGTVITGIDRPWHDLNLHPRFFGLRSDIPVTTIQLAIKANVPIAVIFCKSAAQANNYRLYASPLIYMKAFDDRTEALLHNTELVLKQVETYVKQVPDQWTMFYPVWPQLMKEDP